MLSVQKGIVKLSMVVFLWDKPCVSRTRGGVGWDPKQVEMETASPLALPALCIYNPSTVINMDHPSEIRIHKEPSFGIDMPAICAILGDGSL